MPNALVKGYLVQKLVPRHIDRHTLDGLLYLNHYKWPLKVAYILMSYVLPVSLQLLVLYNSFWPMTSISSKSLSFQGT